MSMDRYRSSLEVGFRVEVHDPQHRSENNTFRCGEGSMVARDPCRGLSNRAFQDHLTWRSRRAGPFISFSNNWNRAMKRRKTFIEQGAQNIIVIAVWLKGLEVSDAYNIACNLGMDCPEQHLDEFLLHGAIWADSYRILAVFHGNLELEDVALYGAGWSSEASIPGGFAHCTQTATICRRALGNATEDFRDEICSLTGTGSGNKLESLYPICGISSILLKHVYS